MSHYDYRTVFSILNPNPRDHHQGVSPAVKNVSISLI